MSWNLIFEKIIIKQYKTFNHTQAWTTCYALYYPPILFLQEIKYTLEWRRNQEKVYQIETDGGKSGHSNGGPRSHEYGTNYEDQVRKKSWY